MERTVLLKCLKIWYRSENNFVDHYNNYKRLSIDDNAAKNFDFFYNYFDSLNKIIFS